MRVLGTVEIGVVRLRVADVCALTPRPVVVGWEAAVGDGPQLARGRLIRASTRVSERAGARHPLPHPPPRGGGDPESRGRAKAAVGAWPSTGSREGDPRAHAC